MSAIYTKITAALLQSTQIRGKTKVRIVMNSEDWEALKEELGQAERDKMWTPGSWLLGTDVVIRDYVPRGDVAIEVLEVIWL